MSHARVAVTLCFLSLLGCGGGQPPPPKPVVAAPLPPPAPLEPVELPAPPPKPTAGDTLKALFDGMNAHDTKAIGACYADGAVVVSDGQSRPAKDAVGDLQPRFDGFPDTRAAVARTWSKGSVTVVEWVWTGKNDAAFLGAAATGRSIGLPVASVFFFDDASLVKEEHDYLDAPTLASQLDAKAKPNTFRAPVDPPTAVEAHVAKNIPDEDVLVEWAKGFDAKLEAGKEDDILKAMTDDAEFMLNFAPNVSKGPTMKRSFHRFLGAFVKQKWEVTNAWGVEDYALVEHTLHARQNGAYGAVRAVKKDVTSHWLGIYLVKDGQLARGWAYTDLGELVAQGKPAPKDAKKK